VTVADIIFHHFATSPFSEKVRIAFGIKQLAWKSVTIPNMMPKPDLMPLTGGYRRTPVLQVGADIYCDSQLILLELEKHTPQPPLLPRPARRGAGHRHVDRPHHLLAGRRRGDGRRSGDKLPAAFQKDRSDFSGRSFDRDALQAARRGARPDLRQLVLAEQMLAMAGPSCSARRRRSPTARSTTRCGSC
jgi:glutathione S-transferase